MLCCFFFAVWIRNESWWQDAGPQLEKGSVCITVLFVNPALSIFEDSLQNLKETKSLVHSLNSAPFITAMQPFYHFVKLQYPEFSLVQSHSWSFFLVPVPSVIFFELISVIQWITWDWSTAHADIKLNKQAGMKTQWGRTPTESCSPPHPGEAVKKCVLARFRVTFVNLKRC